MPNDNTNPKSTLETRQMIYGIYFHLDGENDYLSVFISTDKNERDKLLHQIDADLAHPSQLFYKIGNYRIPMSRIIWWRPYEDLPMPATYSSIDWSGRE